MGATLLSIIVTLALQSPQPDTSLTTSITHRIAFERLSDLLQYNRVQGLSLGLGYQVAFPGSAPAGVYATIRYGLSDERVTGRLTLFRNTPASRITISGYHDIADLDPVSPGRTFPNTFNSLLAGHDNGDYALGRGAVARIETPAGAATELVLGAQVEHLSSVGRVARSAVNDFLGGTGLFPPNPPVAQGTFGKLSARLEGRGTLRWTITADILGGAGQTTGRLFGDVMRELGTELGLTIRIKAGAATQPATAQSLFRVGGLSTVRGFEYGTLRAPAFWAGQIDFTPFGGRIRPVIFFDAGQAADVPDLFSSRALAGAGAGLSLFSGFVRFDLSRPVSPNHGDKIRFDLVIRGAR